MYIGFFSNHKVYNNNKLITDPSSLIGDDLMYPFVLLAQRLKELGHKVATIDTDNIEKFDAVLFLDFPTYKNKYFRQLIRTGLNNMYLLIIESPIVKPDNFDIKNHKYFKKIFTWSDDLVDNKKYFKINYSHNIPTEFNFNLDSKKKLCTMISGNKSAKHPNELYSERIKAVRWFEKNRPDDFDLYGIGWDRYNFYGEFLGIKLARLNRLKILTKIIAPKFPSYKGTIKSKKEIYKKYKFAICYENARDFSGYITEKIFDCLLAGCVPIYLGASNITRHIPKETFIDKRNFKTYDELYSHIKNMPAEDYLKYQSSIAGFLKSNKSYPFSAECFVETIIKGITT